MKITAKDVQAAMTYGASIIAENITVAGVSVEIWQDQDSENPYQGGDGMAPALWVGLGYGMQEFGGAELESFFWRVKPEWVSRQWRKIAAILDLPESEVDSDCRETLKQWGGHLSNIRQEYFSERLAEMESDSWSRAIDYLEALAALYRLAGMAADTFQRNGYCQGDSVYGLIVHTPEWKKRLGFNGDVPRDMQSDADTYGAWAWGDVYGFTVGNDSDDEDAETCGGFYGNDSEYFASEIADAVNMILENRAKIDAAAIQDSRPDLTPCYA